MYRRKQHRLYPVFWAYLIFQFSRVTIECIAYRTSYKFYFYSYWTASACSVIFSFLLLRSIFLSVLEGYSPLTWLRRFGYEAVLLAFWALALFLTYHNYGGRTFSQLIFDAHQAVSFTAVGMFVFVVGSSVVLGIRWTSAICGIALGVGLLGTVDLVVDTVHSHTQLLSNSAVGWIETLAYNCAVGIFALYFVPQREETLAPSVIKPELLQWANSVRGSVSK
jgi:hypothetical protein